MRKNPNDYWLLFDESKCIECGGSGYVLETIDEERWPVEVHCQRCKRFCMECGAWVERKDHECKEKT